ncbi:MAG: hypothetical protein ACR2PZ_05165 [Pseudomonadales bacterium]
MSDRAQALQQTGCQGVFYITGGGSKLISELLTTPGASKTVLEMHVPYAAPALAQLIGQTPEQACSEPTARALAMCGFQRALQLGGTQPFGLGCTAGLATDRAKRGRHRAHVAVQTLSRSLDLRFDFRATRKQEEAALLEGLWEALSRALNQPFANRAPDVTTYTSTQAPKSWQALLLGTSQAVQVTQLRRAQTPKLLLPGSFNPLHAGHAAMLDHAEQVLSTPGAYELAIANVDKPIADYSTVRQRLKAFRSRKVTAPLWLTTLPTFVEKAHAFPRTTFAVGADTVIRVAEPKYYGSIHGRNEALKTFASLESSFLVFGRSQHGRFIGLDDLKLPKALRALCRGVSERDFRQDVSSTALRNNRA